MTLTNSEFERAEATMRQFIEVSSLRRGMNQISSQLVPNGYVALGQFVSWLEARYVAPEQPVYEPSRRTPWLDALERLLEEHQTLAACFDTSGTTLKFSEDLSDKQRERLLVLVEEWTVPASAGF